MIDILNFTRCKNGMEEEYEKILEGETEIIRINGGTKEALNHRYDRLHEREQRYLEAIQNMMIEILLSKRALAEISDNWNKK